MRIAVYGATGVLGSRIATEAESRGHEVTRISRSGTPGGVQGDAHEAAFTAPIAEKHDVVVSAIGPSRVSDDGDRFVESVQNLAATSGTTRLVVVGGAGSLVVGGQRLVDSPDFPELYRGEALKQAAALEALRAQPEGVDWTVLSPAPLIQPGERTGHYQVATDTPAGSEISAEDFAVALVDELETPAHRRARFTVAN